MNKIKNLIFRKRIRNLENSIHSLDRFIQQLYWGEDLSTDEAVKNLEEGLVEIITYEQHSSNGILITEDGYFLTAKHCVDYDLKNKKLRLHDGSIYDIKRVYAWGEKYDIALAKANLPERSEPEEYRLYNTNNLEEIPIEVIVRRDGEVLRRHGFIHKGLVKIDLNYQDQFLLRHIPTKHGDSGGIIISPDGRLIGMLSTGANKDYYASGIKLIKALELVDFHRRKLQEKLD